MVRCLLIAGSIALAACASSGDAGDAVTGEDPGFDSDGGGSAPASDCSAASDCTLAASTCCECPNFAVPIGSQLADGCDGVECPDPSGCSEVTATCEDHRCELLCPRIVTDLVCAAGFARDVAGCLVAACATPETEAECERDAQCVQVPADCCGCARGGQDIAVATSEAALYDQSLGCSGDEACPGVDVCNGLLEPRCVAGRCALTEPVGGRGHPAFCGTPDYPPCLEGTVCVLNSAETSSATQLAVGACLPP